MFGGSDDRNPLLPVFLEQEGFQYGGNALPQLQLFGDCEFSNRLITGLFVGFYWDLNVLNIHYLTQ